MDRPDPGLYFRDTEGRPDPLWVRHDTGRPEWVETAAGLVPYHEYAESLPPPSGPGQSFRAEAGGFSFGLTVTAPKG